VVTAIAEHCLLLNPMSCPPRTSDAAVVKLAQGASMDVSRSLYSPVTINGVHAIKECCPDLGRSTNPSHLRSWPLLVGHVVVI
jgi:hypothetical protein